VPKARRQNAIQSCRNDECDNAKSCDNPRLAIREFQAPSPPRPTATLTTGPGRTTKPPTGHQANIDNPAAAPLTSTDNTKYDDLAL
jgi:hypothetical protein